MRRFLFLLVIACASVGCSSPNNAKQAIREYLKDQISNPETYNAGVIELVSKGSIDVAETKYWRNIPEVGRIDVVLIRHEFYYENHLGMIVDNAYYFYMSPKMDYVYYAHPATGGPLFTLQEE